MNGKKVFKYNNSHSKNRNVAVTKSIYAECCTQRCYCELVTNVVYNNFQDVLVPLGAIQCSREYKKFHLHTFQLFIHATKITNLWSQQHSYTLLGLSICVYTFNINMKFQSNSLLTTFCGVMFQYTFYSKANLKKSCVCSPCKLNHLNGHIYP